jgi:hypothetical protein
LINFIGDAVIAWALYSAHTGTGLLRLYGPAIFFEPVTATRRARILFKAGRYAEAERAARMRSTYGIVPA